MCIFVCPCLKSGLCHVLPITYSDPGSSDIYLLLDTLDLWNPHVHNLHLVNRPLASGAPKPLELMLDTNHLYSLQGYTELAHCWKIFLRQHF